MEIMFVQKHEEEELRSILLDHKIYITGNIEEHVILKKDGIILAGGKINEIDSNLYHLQVLGVRGEMRGKGAGSILLSSLLKQPWKYCLNSQTTEEERYLVSTIARGSEADFYKKHGFRQCSFQMIVPPYNKQCDKCPHKKECEPVPMLYLGDN